MSAVEEKFFHDTSILRSLCREGLLIDRFPPSDPANEKARVLRTGVAVSAFALLERFLSDRIEEKIIELKKSRISYAALRQDLREFLILDALNGISNRIKYQDPADRLVFAEGAVRKLGAALASRPSYTAFGFSPMGSNVYANDLKSVLSALGYQGPWQKMATVCGYIGGSTTGFSSEFEICSRNRNRSAHNSSHNIPTSNLEDHIIKIIMIAICFNIVFTNAISCYKTEATAALAETKMNNLIIDFRFIDEDISGDFVESVSGSARIIARHVDYDTALRIAKTRKRRVPIVVRSVQRIPVAVIHNT